MGLIGKKSRAGQWEGWYFYQPGTCSPKEEGNCVRGRAIFLESQGATPAFCI